jgi:nucleotide-binding universal stress UspA family protein
MSASTKNDAPRIVVGVDGSPSSQAALRWAVRQAELTGGSVDAVLAWQIPAVAGGYG